MKTLQFCAVAARALAAAGAMAAMGLVACADTHWERSVYQGARYGNAQCELRRRPTDAPCAELVDYDRYQQERAKAANPSPPATQVHAIEEIQQ